MARSDYDAHINACDFHAGRIKKLHYTAEEDEDIYDESCFFKGCTDGAIVKMRITLYYDQNDKDIAHAVACKLKDSG